MYLPSTGDEGWAKIVGWTWRIVIVGIGILIGFWRFIEQKEWYSIPLGVLSIVLGSVLGYFGYSWGHTFATNNSRCPNCGKPYCISYIGEKTVSESIVTERKQSATKGKYITRRYRVGVKGITWRCKSCGHEGYGEKEYKKEL